jgi:TIR domain-containing protein
MPEVFVSHRRSDAVAARRLAEALRHAGHSVWLDEWAIHLGDSIVERMNQGLQESAYLILCYSDAGVMSPWISREWMSALARQLEGQHIRILPVMLTGSEVPAILADVHAADLRTDWDKGLALLLRSIN